MHGVIIIQGDKTKFRDNETMKHYLVVGSWDRYGFISNKLDFKPNQEVEAVEDMFGNVLIKFSPI